MPRRLVIVESPAKAKTLAALLGTGSRVFALVGPLWELPTGRRAVDPARAFAVEHEVSPARRRTVAALRAAARECDEILLATDPDREGEALCWQVSEELALAAVPFRRLRLHELTRPAVESALGASLAIDRRKVDAQHAAFALECLVAEGLHPILEDEQPIPTSAGLASWAALGILCDREREIAACPRGERWTVRASFETGAGALLAAALEWPEASRAATRGAADAACRALASAAFRIGAIHTVRHDRRPPPAFVASTLQQEAFRRLGFPVRKTTRIAERLYQGRQLGASGPLGLISYPRTERARASPEAIRAAREIILRRFGPQYVSEGAEPEDQAQREAGAQAIRPTDLAGTPDSLAERLSKDEAALYRLVYERFLASQMASARCQQTDLEIEARLRGAPEAPPSYRLRARLEAPSFRGFLAARTEHDAPTLPDSAGSPAALVEGGVLRLLAVQAEPDAAHVPLRMTEADLVDRLERAGVGRASCYGSVLKILESRGYLARESGRLKPSSRALAVDDLLRQRLPEVLSACRIASIEAALDRIEAGRATRLEVLSAFWRELEPALAAARRGGGRRRGEGLREPGGAPVTVSGETPAAHDGAAVGRCPRCRAPLAARIGRFGPMLACSRYPSCRHVVRKPAPESGLTCPGCHEGRVVEREAEGRRFFGCSRFPACRFTSSHRPIAESCPECGRAYLFQKETKRDGRVVYCSNRGCRYRRVP